MPPTMQLQQSSQSHSPMEKSTLWLSIPAHSPPPNLITTLTIKNSWPSSRLFKNGDITLKVLELRLTLSPITKIWNTSPRQNYYLADKLDGRNSSPNSICA